MRSSLRQVARKLQLNRQVLSDDYLGFPDPLGDPPPRRLPSFAFNNPRNSFYL